jgi:NAD(P)-dependent dehydrogenase (short-subunit alcohol dehydrogenase family)
MRRCKNEIIFITGCNGGVGRELCRVFMAAGYSVVGTDIQADARCDNDLYVPVDLSLLVENVVIQQQLAEVVSNFALRENLRLKAIINNAALQITGSVAELSDTDFLASQRVNVIAPFTLAKLFEARLRDARGAIVNIGSIHARLSKPGFAAYSTSKAALAGLTRALALDFGGDVTVNTISPAATRTDMLVAGFSSHPEKLNELARFHPANRIAEPWEIAKLALFLCSNDARFITGVDIAVDGGIGGRLHDPV